MPIAGATVLAFDWQRGRVLTPARALGHAAGKACAVDRPLGSTETPRLQRWSSAGEILRVPPSPAGGVAGLLLPPEATGSWLVGALRGEHGPCGALLLQARAGAAFDEQHERMLGAVLEPFSAALENDRRLRELASLREAAEADKRSALVRLGRTDLQNVVVGADAGLAPVVQRVALVARSDVPVLLLGETGTGKELIARAIHDSSARARGPFIRVNCGAIAPELIDSELFGHERGAFTGATASRRGWFERADEGTLLLDEVGELPLPAQVRLLRVVQEGSFERVGGEKPVSVDVRIIAATHRDLPAMVQNGRFREDLWYRIAGFPIVLPPLRERRADIRELAEHFADKAARRFGLRRVHLAADDLELLCSYGWPGNVRELASVIDRAAILGDGESLELAKALGVADLHVSGPDRSEERQAPVAQAAELPTLDAAMRAHIECALRRCRGRIEGVAGAAAALGVNPHTLRARMRKLGIEWSSFRVVP
ncbi:MAG: sigma 54-interacting transcriptional regulator [Deltaproteobacteria bacterium]|nr:sigma 54-interacting transcriptional regulator [Deltaproteobacteria bacterium]